MHFTEHLLKGELESLKIQLKVEKPLKCDKDAYRVLCTGMGWSQNITRMEHTYKLWTMLSHRLSMEVIHVLFGCQMLMMGPHVVER